MQAAVGDRLHVHGHAVGDPDRLGEIIEVHGKEGQPPYLVRFEDGRTRLVFPGPDAVVEHPAGKRSRKPAPAGGASRAGAGEGARRGPARRSKSK